MGVGARRRGDCTETWEKSKNRSHFVKTNNKKRFPRTHQSAAACSSLKLRLSEQDYNTLCIADMRSSPWCYPELFWVLLHDEGGGWRSTLASSTALDGVGLPPCFLLAAEKYPEMTSSAVSYDGVKAKIKRV